EVHIMLRPIPTRMNCKQRLAERTRGATNGSITGIATMKKPLRIWPGLPHTKRLVSISSDHTLRSRVIGNDHARFWIGGGGSNPFADHTGVTHWTKNAWQDNINQVS